MQVRVFETFHTVRSVGYALLHRRKRLRAEYASKTGKELAQLRKEGVDINEEVLLPALVYVGDSRPHWHSDPLFRHFSFPFIMCECTFVGALEDMQRASEAARTHGHTCWEELECEIAENCDDANTTYILVHWSNRYDPGQIAEFFETKSNICAWTW